MKYPKPDYTYMWMMKIQSHFVKLISVRFASGLLDLITIKIHQFLYTLMILRIFRRNQHITHLGTMLFNFCELFWKTTGKKIFRTGEKAAQHFNRKTHKVRVESTLLASRWHNDRIDSPWCTTHTYTTEYLWRDCCRELNQAPASNICMLLDN